MKGFSPYLPQFPPKKRGKSHTPVSPACLCEIDTLQRQDSPHAGGWFTGLNVAQAALTLTASETATFPQAEWFPRQHHTSVFLI